MGTLTLLQIVQEFTDRHGQPTPGAVIGTTDAGVRQYRGLLNELCDDFVARQAWQWNVREATFTTVAAESQGVLTTLADASFKGIVPRTVFDRTKRLRLSFLDWEQVQARKAANSTGPWNEIYIRDAQLYSWPAPVAGATWAFDYYSTYFVVGNDGTRKRYWAADTDVWFSDDSIALAWLAWKWLSRKGLDYTEEFQAYEALVASFASTDQPKEKAHIDGTSERRAEAGILVPIGNWPLTNS